MEPTEEMLRPSQFRPSKPSDDDRQHEAKIDHLTDDMKRFCRRDAGRRIPCCRSGAGPEGGEGRRFPVVAAAGPLLKRSQAAGTVAQLKTDIDKVLRFRARAVRWKLVGQYRRPSKPSQERCLRARRRTHADETIVIGPTDHLGMEAIGRARRANYSGADDSGSADRAGGNRPAIGRAAAKNFLAASCSSPLPAKSAGWWAAPVTCAIRSCRSNRPWP
jgi:hypothetical protein